MRHEHEIEAMLAELRREAVEQMPPFSARSIATAREIGPTASAALIAELDRDESAFLAVEALREADPVTWEALVPERRAAIYARALAGSVMFNAWGLPGRALTGTSRAFASLGNAAVPVLVPLLGRHDEAPLEGSRDATAARVQRNRIRDYAWVLLCEALRRPYDYDDDPAVRDRAIDELEATL